MGMGKGVGVVVGQRKRREGVIEEGLIRACMGISQ